jgi:hypothetical protein
VIFLRATFASGAIQVFLAPDANAVLSYFQQEGKEPPVGVLPEVVAANADPAFLRTIPKLRMVPGRGVRRCLRGVSWDDLHADDEPS